MSARSEAREWAAAVEAVAAKRRLRHESVGGLNPVGAPAALCVGGTNRVVGELAKGFWGACCDAEEEQAGRLLSRAALPRAALCKAHVPDVAAVVPDFSIEAVEGKPEDAILRHARNRVEFESIAFNRKYIATVPSHADPVPVRELFSPALLDWMARIDNQVDAGLNAGQLFFLWRYRERSAAELEAAMDAAGGLFERVYRELDEAGAAHRPPGPWNAGLEPFPQP